MKHAGMAGIAVGLDLLAALQLGQDLGFDRQSLAVLLPLAETALIEALAERAKDRAGAGEKANV